MVAQVSGDERLLNRARAGLAPGGAVAEAVAVRLRRQGVELTWGDPVVVPTTRELLARCAERGRSSVEVARVDPSLLTELQLGAWFDSVWWGRLARRLSVTAVRPPAWAELRLAADAAFWRGVRSRATAAEWERWTRESYTALVYHRLAGERKTDQERIDLDPEQFARQLRVLRRLGFRHLEPHELLALHDGGRTKSARRAFVVTVDDGLLDCLAPLLLRPERGIHLFVSTAEVGGRAHWLDDEPLLAWRHVRELGDANIVIGSHARHHQPLTGLEPGRLADELEGSRLDLGRELAPTAAFLAYPNGAHDAKVRTAAARAGFRAAFTTAKGRNSPGTDKYCLRRLSVHEADGALAVLWKVVTGEGLPSVWLRLRALRRKRCLGGHKP
ncbi:MAG: polysaccharide deacetylase family protein [Gaiellaceae bacterium]